MIRDQVSEILTDSEDCANGYNSTLILTFRSESEHGQTHYARSAVTFLIPDS